MSDTGLAGSNELREKLAFAMRGHTAGEAVVALVDLTKNLATIREATPKFRSLVVRFLELAARELRDEYGADRLNS